MTGFTLIETVVALLLASVIAAALATSTGAALRHEVAAGRREHAAEIAAEGLERMLAGAAEDLAPRANVETIVRAGERFTLERSVAPGPAPGLWRLAAVARAEHGGAPVALVTLRRAAWTPQ